MPGTGWSASNPVAFVDQNEKQPQNDDDWEDESSEDEGEEEEE
jgi:hypothetical protein